MNDIEIRNIIKKNTFINKLRTYKWKRLSRSVLFSQNEIVHLENHPEMIPTAINRKLKTLPDQGESLLECFEKIYMCSPLADRKDLDKKSLKTDMLFWHFAYGFTLNEYACYQFADKGYEERRSFLSDRDAAWLCYDMNDLRKMSVLADKAATYEQFKQYYGREAVVISNETDYEKYYSFIESHGRFVKKNALESCGRGVELVDIEKSEKSLQDLFIEWVGQGKVILEEVVEQSGDLSSFNESSVNTLRCITFQTRTGIVVPFVFFKTGRQGFFIDNGSAGGILVAVDLENGMLGNGTDEYGNRYDKHPDSGVPFVGFQLPDWKQAIDMCIDMSSHLPGIGIIGWDLAHMESGWIVIEGNSMTEWIGPQSTRLHGIREEVRKLRA